MNKSALIATVVAGLVTVSLGLNTLSASSALDDLKARQVEATADIAHLERSIAEKRAKRDTDEREVIREVTGLDPSLVESDRAVAATFFETAFQWDDSTSYRAARNDYIEKLGKDNAFTKTYMPLDPTIETDDGELSYIDHTGVRSEFDGFQGTPLTADGTTVNYIGVARHYMLTKDTVVDSDAARKALKASEAVVTYTIKDDPDNPGTRMVTDVDAWAGYESSSFGD